MEAGWGFFDRRLASVGGAAGVAARVLSDQLILAPPSVAVFFISQSLMEGLSLSACAERTSAAFWPTYQVCFPYWCCCHVLTFSVVPPGMRIAYASCCGMLWNAIISGQNQAAIQRESQGLTAGAVVEAGCVSEGSSTKQGAGAGRALAPQNRAAIDGDKITHG